MLNYLYNRQSFNAIRMFARILKLNPFHDEHGKFAKAPASHVFAKDMSKQYDWLKAKTKRLHVDTVDELVEKHPDKFMEFASMWRKKHPLPN